MGDLTNDFSSKELACPCCGLCKMDPIFLAKLQAMRDQLSKPIKINSGYRCNDHNKAVGGEPNSQHLYGKAVDIAVTDGAHRIELLKAAFLFGFRGFGFDQAFLHIDTRDGPITSWVYPL